MPAIAAYDLSYLNAVPYLTATEYQQAPTGVDTSALITTGPRDPATQLAALQATIARASAWADGLCQQILAATRNTEIGRYRVRRDGVLSIPPKYFPVIEVDTVLLGYTPAGMTAISATDLSNVVPFEHHFEVPASSWCPGDRPLAQYTYVNGYPHGTLGADVAAAAMSITVSNPLGIYAGTPLMIYDGSSTEQVTASGSPAGNVVPILSPLGFGHKTGVSVSALPADVKQAVISLTSCLIKTRGTGAMVMTSMNRESMKAADAEAGAVDDLALAIDLLGRFKRVLR